MLRPLEQWYCDTCGEIIEKPKDGWVHWRTDQPGKAYGFEIMHHARASPRGGFNGCYHARMEQDMHLEAMLGPRGIVRLLSLVDAGSYHDRAGSGVPGVADLRGWVELFRRLHLPYYEEARLYFERARQDGHLQGESEVALYLEATLKSLCETYGDQG